VPGIRERRGNVTPNTAILEVSVKQPCMYQFFGEIPRILPLREKTGQAKIARKRRATDFSDSPRIINELQS
jgi:hypothetical protein